MLFIPVILAFGALICGVVGAKDKSPFWNGAGIIFLALAIIIPFVMRMVT